MAVLKEFFKLWYKHDWWITAASAILVGLGLAMLFSTSLGQSDHYVSNQLLFAAAGAIIYLVVAFTPRSFSLRLSPILYLFLLSLMIVLVVAGQITRGAASWLYFGPFSLQPSELMKVVVIMTCIFIYQKGWQIWAINWTRHLLYSLVALLPIVLTFLQPDLGTAVIMAAGWLTLLWLTIGNKKVLVAGGLLIVIGCVVGWSVLAPYQQQRVLTFLNPTADPLGSGYNVLQSIISVQSGGLTGQGWGQGTQSHLNFLPEHHTDFIFASLSEELGFAGGITVILCYSIILWRGSRAIWHNPDQSSIMLVAAVMMMLLAQAIINMAMNVGLAPVTGIPLPLVSYGGSSMITSFITLALIQNISQQQARREASQK